MIEERKHLLVSTVLRLAENVDPPSLAELNTKLESWFLTRALKSN